MYVRRHFSGWVENESFSTFHFRHRPEKGKSYTASNFFTLVIHGWKALSKFVGKDVAVAERAVAEEQTQRIDLMQKYSEETCTRVHLPGGLLLFLEETCAKVHL